MQTLPFYTLAYRYGSEAVWHDNDECSIARGIALVDRKEGQDHLRSHCKTCLLLNGPVVPLHHGQGAYSDVLAGVIASRALA